MPKISTFTDHCRFILGCRCLSLITLLIIGFLLFPGVCLGQSKPIDEKALQAILPAKLGDQWRATGEARSISAGQFSILPVGDVFAEYGLKAISARDYSDGKTRLSVEIFQMDFTSSAFGLHSFNKGTLAPNRREFFDHQYLVSLSTEPQSATPDANLDALIRQLLPQEDAGLVPPLPLHLPEDNKIAGSEKYFIGPLALSRRAPFEDLKDVVVFTGGAEAASALYRNGGGELTLLLIEYHTPQLAVDGYAKIRTYFDALPEAERAKRILTKTGNYVIQAVNVEDMTAAQQMVSRIKYSPKVFWEGKKVTDIPLVFRPADPTAVEEAFQTANVLIRTFYWIGIMLTSALVLGIIAGGSIFYWKRYRRRKRGLDDLFSDAGGTVRLNLDDYLLSDPEEAVKRIGKGNDE